jgi:uncharacterized protein (DUF1800 family)
MIQGGQTMPEVTAKTKAPSPKQTPKAMTRRDLLGRWWSTQKTATAGVAAAGAAAGTATAKAVSVMGQATGFGEREAAHLMRRAGFGATTEEIQDLVARGKQGAVDYLVNFENINNDAMEADLTALVQDVPRNDRADPGFFDLNNFRGIQGWWAYRMVNSARQFEEKMTLFWHNHFATAVSKVNRADYMLDQNQLFRSMALDNFRDILVSVSMDPAMILWLDNNTNIAGSPNENFARELMELFSLGIDDLSTGDPNYSEFDIQEVARAFTGWTVRRQGFFFNTNQHDDGPKTVFGQTGNFGGEDIVDLIVVQDAAALFMAKKFWEFFVYQNPEPAILDELAQVYFDSNYSIHALVTHMFLMDEFYSDRAMFGQIKSPTEFAIGALRQLSLNFDDGRPYQAISGLMSTMDQDIFNPPTVAGWDGDLSWINTSTLLVRYNAANTITQFDQRRFGTGFNPEMLVQSYGTDPEAIVDGMLDQLGPLEISDDTRFLLVEYLTDGDLTNFTIDNLTLQSKVRGLAHLVMSLPEYQLN